VRRRKMRKEKRMERGKSYPVKNVVEKRRV
jgi:hypothetical protein